MKDLRVRGSRVINLGAWHCPIMQGGHCGRKGMASEVIPFHTESRHQAWVCDCKT